jgi:hypothetical protein
MTDPSVLAEINARNRERSVEIIEKRKSHVNPEVVDFLLGRREANMLHAESGAVDVAIAAAQLELADHLLSSKASAAKSSKKQKGGEE